MHFSLCVYVCIEGAVIEVTDEQPPSSTMSLVLTDIVGLRTYCTGLRFYRPFVVEEVMLDYNNKSLILLCGLQNGDQYRLKPCSRSCECCGVFHI